MSEWSESLCLQLIELFKGHECLWNPSFQDYNKKNLKEDAWRNIGEEMNKAPADCKIKMENLKASFRRELKKVVTTTTGQGANEVFVSRWYAFQAFEFMRDKNKPRATINSEDSTSRIVTRATEDDENPDDPQPLIEGGSSTSANQDSFIAPTPRKKVKVDPNASFIKGAYDMMKTATENLKNTPWGQMTDETTSFFNFVTAKVRNYSPQTKQAVQHAIYDVLMKADMGYYDWNETHTQYSYRPQYSNNQSFNRPSTECTLVPASSRASPISYPSPPPSTSPALSNSSATSPPTVFPCPTPSISPALSHSPATSPPIVSSPHSIHSTASSPSPVRVAENLSMASYHGDTFIHRDFFRQPDID